MLRLVLRAQAVYYILTGVWPLVSMRAFELVTGPKVDDWLVQMVGLLAAAIGATLWIGTRDDRIHGSLLFLSVASAASFAAIDIRHALADRISDIYLLDAVAEVGIVAIVMVGWMRRPRGA